MKIFLAIFCTLLSLLHIVGPVNTEASDLSPIQQMIEHGSYSDAARQLKLLLHADETDAQARFLLARVLSWQGNYRESLLEYDRLLAVSPESADYLLGKGRTLLWDKRPGEALPLLRKARLLAPDYREIYEVEISALVQDGEDLNQADLDRLVEEAQQRFPDHNWMVQKPPQPELITDNASAKQSRPWEFEAGASFSSLNNNYDNWRSTYVHAACPLPLDSPTSLYATVRQTRRFNEDDSEFLAGIHRSLSTKWSMLAEANGSPTHNILPRWSALGEISYRFKEGFVLHGGLRRTEFDTSSDLRELATIEYYAGSYRTAYILTATQLDGGGSATVHRLEATSYYCDDNFVTFGGSLGREVENTNQGLIISDVWGVYLTGRHWLTNRTGFTFEFGVHEQDTFYTRKDITVGIRHIF